MPSEDWRRLARYVVSRRVDLGMEDRVTFAARAKLSRRSIGNVENGLSVSGVTLAKVASALGWSPDSPDRVLHGREPILTDSAQVTQSESERFAAWVARQITASGGTIRTAQDFLSAEGLPGPDPGLLSVEFYRRLSALTRRPLAEVMVEAGAVPRDELIVMPDLPGDGDRLLGSDRA